MSILQAFIDQIIFAIFAAICIYFQRDQLGEGFWKSGIYYLLFFNFTLLVWMRWYFNMPLIGVIGYLFE